MAEYIKIPHDFFESEQMKKFTSDVVLLYLNLLCETNKNAKGVFEVGNLALTDDVLRHVFTGYDHIEKYLKVLEYEGLIKRRETSIQVFKFWDDLHDRNSERYKAWRMSVFERDGFVCVACGSKKDLQAHHIKTWKKNKKLRYEVSNGITLCRKCHLRAHGGCWRNG